jgi:all-trans-8'-apo-beta-carotenal 15,15'-oxygenase
VLGEKNPAQLISYDPCRPTKVHVVPRYEGGGREQRCLTIPACFVFHHGRGFELGGEPGGERLIVDSVVLDAFPEFDKLTRPGDDADRAALKALDFGAVPINRFVRFEIDLRDENDDTAVTQATPRPRAVEFPCTGAVAARAPHQHVYGACVAHASLNNPFQGVVRIDMVSGEEVCHFPGPRCFTNEPIFVPRPCPAAEDDGWLLVLVFDAEAGRSGLFIYDAPTLDQGPLAVAWLRHAIPYGLHGSWVDGETFGALDPGDD